MPGTAGPEFLSVIRKNKPVQATWYKVARLQGYKVTRFRV
jgi:hypothetical protein